MIFELPVSLNEALRELSRADIGAPEELIWKLPGNYFEARRELIWKLPGNYFKALRELSKADIGAPWELRASSFEAQMKLMKNFVSSSGAPREFSVLYG